MDTGNVSYFYLVVSENNMLLSKLGPSFITCKIQHVQVQVQKSLLGYQANSKYIGKIMERKKNLRKKNCF